MQTNYFKDSKIALEEAGKKLNEILLGLKGQKTLLLSCGGSTIGALNYVKDESLGEWLTFGMLDDRLQVPFENNNFHLMTETHFYKRALNKKVEIIDTAKLKDMDAGDAGRIFDALLKEYFHKNPKTKVIVTMGMGPDGHIAGMMPEKDENNFAKKFQDENILGIGYKVSEKNDFPYRLTSTYTMLEKIDKAVVYITGEQKREKLAVILKGGEIEKNTVPASILNKMKEVHLFTDIKI